MLSTVRRRMARLEVLAGRTCPACSDWPSEVAVRVVEVIIEPGAPLPAPDQNDPALFGPCEVCGRTFRAKVVEVEGD
jgi:hypothetical protein